MKLLSKTLLTVMFSLSAATVYGQLGLDFAIVRPPAVYGPGDKETLELFRMAKLGLILLPPAGRLSLPAGFSEDTSERPVPSFTVPSHSQYSYLVTLPSAS